tara:strand:- start:23162 stop:25192 length:2031 start_codon:yes stop_codon:yes gene_type:complete
LRLNFCKILPLFFIVYFGYSQSSKTKTLADSIQILISSSEVIDISNKNRFHLLQKANTLATQIGNDSIILNAQVKMSYYYLDNDDYDNYKLTNYKILDISERINDSTALGKIYFALGYSHFFTEEKDSSYYYYSKSAAVYDKLNMNVDLSYALGSISKLQLDGKDYYGASESAVKGLNLLKDVEETNDILDQKWILNNTLSTAAQALDDYDQALAYYDIAYKIAGRMENDFNNGIYTLNNIAFLKRKNGFYTEAKQIYNEILTTNDLYEVDPSFYALILENLAYTNYLTGTFDEAKIITIFERSYKISDSLNDQLTKVGTVISMSKFYNGIDDKIKALKYANEAYSLAKTLKTTDILLESMLVLSELKGDDNGEIYLTEYIKLSDSLLKVERNTRNKRARIEFETDKIEAQNEQISKENVYLVILLIGFALTAIIVYLFISQRAKNRKLKLIQLQQKANEDIYNLMLVQQDKIDEARAKEKIRVSKELHDGVLGRLFGTRLSLDSINFKEGKEAMLLRSNYISQLKILEDDIRKISHELNTDFVSGTGFIDILSELIENQTNAYGLKNEFNYTDDISWDLVSNKTKINIYRIIQESMQNIYKHANAKLIKISISLEKAVICLDITDDGVGFDASKSKRGIGLKNMVSRVEDIGGSIIFKSQPGNGTTVNVNIPYTN